ncbi:SUMO1 sentrin specific peptidase 1 [Coemansia sp. Benny D115]|nr:SUMO1 sentrin specific peptidase 1 [Coemansia sp. Benny D115]
MPGCFPDRSQANRRRSDDDVKQTIYALVYGPLIAFAYWLSGNTPPKQYTDDSTQSIDHDSLVATEGARVQGWQRQYTCIKKNHRLESHLNESGTRRPLIAGSHTRENALRKELSNNLVREYTAPHLSTMDYAQLGFGLQRSVYGTRTRSISQARSETLSQYSVDDAKSAVSIDGTGREYFSFFAGKMANDSGALKARRRTVATGGRLPVSGHKGAEIEEDQWVARVRKTIEKTLAISSATVSPIHTPVYDLICKADGDLEQKLQEAQKKKAPSFTLPDDASEVIDSATSAGFTCELNNVPVTARDLKTLAPGQWLNDEVINFYMQLIIARSSDEGMPSVHAFNTFFFSTLRDNGYQRVRKWTRRVKLFDKDLIIVPVHLGVHWCCAIVDFANKSIAYYDALLGDNDACLGLLLDYLCEESRDKLGREMDTSGWTLECKKDIPRQQNGYDCGVFAITFAEYATRRAPLLFSQKNCPYLRRKIIYEIATKQLLGADRD